MNYFTLIEAKKKLIFVKDLIEKLPIKILIFLIILFLVLILNFIVILRIKIKINFQKIYSFECGFDTFEQPRNPFSILFFKILLIFLLFDIEIIIVLPFPLFEIFDLNILILILLIITILLRGLIFEWLESSLEWLK